MYQAVKNQLEVEGNTVDDVQSRGSGLSTTFKVVGVIFLVAAFTMGFYAGMNSNKFSISTTTGFEEDASTHFGKVSTIKLPQCIDWSQEGLCINEITIPGSSCIADFSYGCDSPAEGEPVTCAQYYAYSGPGECI